MDRAQLHRLVDSLPEAAVENAGNMLQHMQVWPPQPPPEMARIQELERDHIERMRRSMRPGTSGTGGGGGNFNPTTGYGHTGHNHREDDTLVHETFHVFKGHEIAVTERLRFADDGKAIHYTHDATGPKGDTRRTEMEFAVP